MEKDQGRELISKSYPVPHHCAKTMITQAANKIQPSTVRGRRENKGLGQKWLPETSGKHQLKECSQQQQQRETWELLDRAGEGPTRGDMFCYQCGCQQGFVWEHLNDSEGVESLRERLQGTEDVPDQAGEVMWLWDLCFKWAAWAWHTECCWQAVRWPQGDSLDG